MLDRYILEHAQHHGLKEREVYEAYKVFFGTLVSESRLKIINLLRKGNKSVSEIARILNLPQPTASHDLARLKKCGFVNVKVDKNFRYYSLNKKTILPLMKLIDVHMEEFCIHIVKEMKEERQSDG